LLSLSSARSTVKSVAIARRGRFVGESKADSVDMKDAASTSATRVDAPYSSRRIASPTWREERWWLTLAIVLPSLVTFVYFVYLRDRPSGFQQIAYAVGKTVQFSLPIVAWLWLGRPRRKVPSSDAKWWWIGAAFGAVVFGLIASAYFFGLRHLAIADGLTQQVQAKISGLAMATPSRYLMLSLFYCVVHSFLEEYYWRWFVFDRLAAHLRLVYAIWIASLGFMLHHVIVLSLLIGWQSPWTYLFSLGVAVGGATWAWLYDRSGRLGPSWLSHFLVDGAILGIGYFLVRPLWA
jgi:hypothetical protein